MRRVIVSKLNNREVFRPIMQTRTAIVFQNDFQSFIQVFSFTVSLKITRTVEVEFLFQVLGQSCLQFGCKPGIRITDCGHRESMTSKHEQLSPS